MTPTKRDRARRREEHLREIRGETDDGPWVLYVEGGRLMKRRPYCDCERKGHGFTKRDDGAWVRPCCMRRERAAWEKHGDGPMEHNPLSCPVCREQEANQGNPVLTQNK